MSSANDDNGRDSGNPILDPRFFTPASNYLCAVFVNVNAWKETIGIMARLLYRQDAFIGVPMDYQKIDTSPASVLSSRKRVIERQALPDELADRLRDMITRGELRPGARINTPRLCTRFGVSRTPLREALKILATEGLVQLMPNRSAVVQRVTDDVINELIPIVGALAALAGRIACARITDDALAELEAMHELLLQHLDQRDETSYMEVESEFIATVFAVAGNKTLKKCHATLIMKLQWQSASHHSLAEWKQTFEVQKQLLQALQIRDGELWALVAYRHVLHRAALLLRGTDLRSSGKMAT